MAVHTDVKNAAPMSGTEGNEPACLGNSGAVAVLAHLCLNALAALEVGLGCLGDPHLQLSSCDREVLVRSVMSGIRQVEALSESLARGVVPTQT